MTNCFILKNEFENKVSNKELAEDSLLALKFQLEMQLNKNPKFTPKHASDLTKIMFAWCEIIIKALHKWSMENSKNSVAVAVADADAVAADAVAADAAVAVADAVAVAVADAVAIAAVADADVEWYLMYWKLRAFKLAEHLSSENYGIKCCNGLVEKQRKLMKEILNVQG